MKQRTRLILDIATIGLVVVVVAAFAVCCIGLDQYSEDRSNHRQLHHEGE